MEKVQEYIYTIYKTKSFSLAAHNLYISQPSLSASVKRFEQALGFEIFNRSKSPLTLTPEGKIYIDFLEETIENEKNMLHRINSLSSMNSNLLTLGGSGYAARKLIPRICGELHRQCPDVMIMVNMEKTSNSINKNNTELIISSYCDTSKFDSELLFPDRMLVATTRNSPELKELMPYALTYEDIVSHKNLDEFVVEDIRLFDKLQFISRAHSGSTWQYASELMQNCSLSKFRLVNAKSMDAYYDMTLEGLGASIISEMIVSSYPKNDDVVFFLPRTEERYIQIIYKKGTVLSNAANKFIEIAKALYSDKNKGETF